MTLGPDASGDSGGRPPFDCRPDRVAVWFGDVAHRCPLAARDRAVIVDAGDHPGSADTAPTVDPGPIVATLSCRHVVAVRVVTARGSRPVPDATVALLVAAGRFADRVAARDPALAERAIVDPPGAARAALARGGWRARTAAETGFALALFGWRRMSATDRSATRRATLRTGAGGPTRT